MTFHTPLPSAMTFGPVLADVGSPADLHNALRERAEQLELSRAVLDEVAGLPTGYAGKLLAAEPQKTLGPLSMAPLLGALGCRLVLVGDPAALARLQRVPKRDGKHVRSGSNHWRNAKKAEAPPPANDAPVSLAAVRLNKARSEALSDERRTELARQAAQARWGARRRRKVR
jgi:hypothetical protein